MSVILWGAEDFGNVARYLSPGSHEYDLDCREHHLKSLATVSVANAEEFHSTYGERHGVATPVTAEEIAEAVPFTQDPKKARSCLKLLAYNAHGSEEGRLVTLEALTSLLTSAVQCD